MYPVSTVFFRKDKGICTKVYGKIQIDFTALFWIRASPSIPMKQQTYLIKQPTPLPSPLGKIASLEAHGCWETTPWSPQKKNQPSTDGVVGVPIVRSWWGVCGTVS